MLCASASRRRRRRHRAPKGRTPTLAAAPSPPPRRRTQVALLFQHQRLEIKQFTGIVRVSDALCCDMVRKVRPRPTGGAPIAFVPSPLCAVLRAHTQLARSLVVCGAQYDAYQRINKDTLDPMHEGVTERVRLLQKNLVEILSSHISAKNVQVCRPRREGTQHAHPVLPAPPIPPTSCPVRIRRGAARARTPWRATRRS